MDNADLKMTELEQQARMDSEDAQVPDVLADIATYCMHCGTRGRLRVDPRDYVRWKGGTLIQVAMPYLSTDERELLISNTCSVCWGKMFGGE